MDQQFIENKLKPILMYMGLIVSGIMSVAYIIIVFVLIKGFKVEAVLNTTIFSIVTSAIGFCIMQMLKIQGQTFAKNLEKNKPIVEAYSKRLSTKKNKRKYRSMNYYMIKTGISDIVSKCFFFGFASVGMVYVMIEGSGDYSLLLLALVNLLMFAGYGLINLCKAYDFYNEEYVPYMLDKIKEAEELEAVDNKVETKNTADLEVAEKEPHKQTNVNFYTAGGSHILVTSDCNESTSNNSGSVVVDNDNNNNTVLGRSIHTSSTTSDSTNICTEENTSKNNQEKESED